MTDRVGLASQLIAHQKLTPLVQVPSGGHKVIQEVSAQTSKGVVFFRTKRRDNRISIRNGKIRR